MVQHAIQICVQFVMTMERGTCVVLFVNVILAGVVQHVRQTPVQLVTTMEHGILVVLSVAVTEVGVVKPVQLKIPAIVMERGL